MINVNILFVFVAAVAILGFILNSLFDKIKITSILPLMLIGLLIGPALHLINTGPGSVVQSLTPYISALAIAFILFDVGLNMDPKRLRKVFYTATKFTFAAAIGTGLVLGAIAYLTFGWNLIESMMFGFALSGPSSIIVPTLVKVIRAPDDLKTTLLYESVTSDTVELIIPIILLEVLVQSNLTPVGVFGLVIATIFGSIIFGVAAAILWLFIMNRFKSYSREYSWMLTIAVVLAAYGISEIIGLNGLITVFVFGIIFTAVGSNSSSNTGPAHEPSFAEKYLSLPDDVEHIKSYQREVALFTSTFFFVYIGMLFSVSSATILAVLLTVMLALVIILVRSAFVPMLKGYMDKDPSHMSKQSSLISYNVARGLSPSIVATLPLAAGIIIPGFLDAIFMVILFTNVVSTIGIFFAYRDYDKTPKKPAA